MGNDYAYDPNHPHAAAQVSQDNTTPNTVVGQYAYDANGNMTCRMENGEWFIQTYNAENRLATVQKVATGTCSAPTTYAAEWDFSYDGDGTRVAQAYTPYDSNGNPQATVVTAYFMGGAYEVTGSSVRKYYAVAGMTIAMNDGTGLKYLLTDHLGSVVAITDNSGTLINQQRYLPFGQVRTDGYVPNSPITGTDFGFTGQRSLDVQGNVSLGLMDYHARMYDPYLNQWTQPDSIIPNVSNPQSLNRYLYVLGNPIRYNDPTGKDPWGCAPDSAGEQACITREQTNYNDSQRIIKKNNSASRDTKTAQSGLNCQPASYSKDNPCNTGAAIVEGVTPSNWNLNPSNPDYWVFSGSVSFFTGSVEIDRYGQWYFAFGGTLDVMSSFFNIPDISVRAGNVNGYGGAYQKFPGPSGMDAFLTGFSANGGGGLLGGGSETWAPFAGKYVQHTGTEWGAYFPGSLGVSATYAVSGRQIEQFSNKWSSLIFGNSP